MDEIIIKNLKAAASKVASSVASVRLAVDTADISAMPIYRPIFTVSAHR